MQSLPIEQIIIGERIRDDMGELDVLATSLREIGLLHPVVVDSGGRLIAGLRRIRAAQELGWTKIPVITVDLDAIARGEFDENACRKGFTPSEAVAIKRVLEPLEKGAAKERQREGGRRGGQASGKLPQASGRAADKVARAIGISRHTLERAEEIIAAAEAEPTKFGKFKSEMDRTGRVNGIFRQLKVARQAEAIRSEPPPLPGRGPYRVIVADPPWRYFKRSGDLSHEIALPYPSMSVEEICALPVTAIAASDCILWLWTTNAHMRDAYVVLDAWGFEEKTILTWAKKKKGMGDWLRGQTEHCIMAIRGKPVVTLSNQSTLFLAPTGGHSVKPIEFYDFVESLCPAPRYADLFSRYQHNERWDCHGDEVPSAMLLEAAE